jgi:hypothetical protein
LTSIHVMPETAAAAVLQAQAHLVAGVGYRLEAR